MSIRPFVTFLFLLFALAVASNSLAREWTAKSGHKITGDFVSLQDGIVQIAQVSRNSEIVTEIPLAQLSEEDQKFVKSQTAKKDDNPFVVKPATSVKLGYTTPRNVLEQEAQKDNPEALLLLSSFYFTGSNGYSKDENKAAELSQRGAQFADTGNPAAQCCRARCYDNGWGVRKDEAEAVKWYRLAAEQGNANAQNNLGVCYMNGNGVREDEAEAVKWYRLAAEQGNANAQNNLGVCYMNGNGVREDEAEAVKWYRKAAEQGYADAYINLAQYYLYKEDGQDMAEAIKWYRKAAEQGDGWAMSTLADLYAGVYAGGEGIQDMAEAVKWWRKLADQGNTYAMVKLAGCYLDGNGVYQDRAEAIKWHRKAGELIPKHLMSDAGTEHRLLETRLQRVSSQPNAGSGAIVNAFAPGTPQHAEVERMRSGQGQWVNTSTHPIRTTSNGVFVSAFFLDNRRFVAVFGRSVGRNTDGMRFNAEVWDSETGKRLQTFSNFNFGSYNQMEVTPDGRKKITIDGDFVRIWALQ